MDANEVAKRGGKAEYGEVNIETAIGLNVAFAYQIVGDRAYLDLAGKGAVFALGVARLGQLEEGLNDTPAAKATSEKAYQEAIGSQLEKAVGDLKRRHGLEVILAGRLPTVWQLRPDLERFYVGLPDDYRLDEAYGFRLKQEPVRITIGRSGFPSVSLVETRLRKMASTLAWQKGENGSTKVAPMEGRETDVSDLYLITVSLLGQEKADRVAALRTSYWKTKLPDLYARMRAVGLLTGVE